ncbi:MAG: transporter substrate-binding domain-containing protein [Coriobacteriia bacterium]|nr:transporter substrate-binding domain-containing protein [Coriobacteriia bacterium]
MKRKIFAVAASVAALALSACMLASCGGGSAAPAEKEKLVVGFDAAYPPYGYLAVNGEEGYKADDGNTYTGFDLDLANEVCNMNNWELVVKPVDWDSKDALLGSGDINCIWNGFTYEGREDQYAWSDKYMVNGQVVVVKKDSGINSLADLKGKIVMTQKESAALDVLEGDMKDLASTFKKLETIGDYNNAFMQLESGAVDAVACDLSIAAYQTAADDGDFEQLEETLSSEHYAVGLAKGDEEKAKTITESLKKLDSEGKIEPLCEKYAVQGMDYANWCLGK